MERRPVGAMIFMTPEMRGFVNLPWWLGARCFVGQGPRAMEQQMFFCVRRAFENSDKPDEFERVNHHR